MEWEVMPRGMREDYMILILDHNLRVISFLNHFASEHDKYKIFVSFDIENNHVKYFILLHK
jgi:hypothetical protein